MSGNFLTNDPEVAASLTHSGYTCQLLRSHIHPDDECSVSVPINTGDTVSLVYTFLNHVPTDMMLLLFTLDALSERNCRVTLYLPYLPYARQDRITRAGEALSVRVLAQALSHTTVASIFIIDVHNPDSLTYFSVPTINVSANKQMAKHIKSHYALRDALCLSPDIGATHLAEGLAEQLAIPVASASKKRFGDTVSISLPQNISRSGVHTVVVRDDLIATGTTLRATCQALFAHGVEQIIICVSHSVPTSDACGEELLKDRRITFICTDSLRREEVDQTNIAVLSFLEIFSLL